jgi:hypothetical protein
MTETQTRVRIVGAEPEVLDELANFLRETSAGDYRVVLVHDTEEGFREEPVTIAIAIVTGSAAVAQAIIRAAGKWLVEREKTKQVAIGTLRKDMRITMEEGHRRRTYSLEQAVTEAAGDEPADDR